MCFDYDDYAEFLQSKTVKCRSRKIAKDAGKLFRRANMQNTPRKSATHFSAVKRASELFCRSLLRDPLRLQLV
jgi:hypothetical protein